MLLFCPMDIVKHHMGLEEASSSPQGTLEPSYLLSQALSVTRVVKSTCLFSSRSLEGSRVAQTTNFQSWEGSLAP